MITVSVFNAHPTRNRVPSGVKTIVPRVLRSEGISNGSIAVVFTDDTMSRRINRKFLSHDRPTDVISFPLEREPALEGEIYVNIDKAERQSRTWKVTLNNELARLVIHGTLHLAGYDDGAPRQARRMKAAEDRYVALLAGKDTRTP
jgi:probable rRNA maturation factor